MRKRIRRSLSTTVSLVTFETIQQTAIELDCCHSVLIDRIVKEWVENTKRQPLKSASEPNDWDSLQATLDDIDSKLKWIERALCDRV